MRVAKLLRTSVLYLYVSQNYNDENITNIELVTALARELREGGLRSKLLAMVDVIERVCGIHPRTSELRDMWKQGKIGQAANQAAKN